MQPGNLSVINENRRVLYQSKRAIRVDTNILGSSSKEYLVDTSKEWPERHKEKKKKTRTVYGNKGRREFSRSRKRSAVTNVTWLATGFQLGILISSQFFSKIPTS